MKPRLARRVLEITAGRLQRSVRREQGLAFMNAQARLARHLLTLEEQEGGKGYVTTSQEDLANGTGLIRQTVAKALGSWRRDGWLKTSRGRIVILNRKALEAGGEGLSDFLGVSPRRQTGMGENAYTGAKIKTESPPQRSRNEGCEGTNLPQSAQEVVGRTRW